MTTNSPAAAFWIRRAGAVLILWVGATSLGAKSNPAAALSAEPISPATETATRCVDSLETSRVVVMRCDEHANAATRLSRDAIRLADNPARRLQLTLGGWDLRASPSGGLRPAALAAAERSRSDFPAGAREVNSLRWTWASVALKF